MSINKRRNSATVNIFLPPESEIKWPQFHRSFIAVSRCVKLLICALNSNLLRGENKDLGRHLLLPEAFFHISPITTKVTFRFFFHDSSVISHNLLRLHHYFLYFLIFRKKNRSLFFKATVHGNNMSPNTLTLHHALAQQRHWPSGARLNLKSNHCCCRWRNVSIKYQLWKRSLACQV